MSWWEIALFIIAILACPIVAGMAVRSLHRDAAWQQERSEAMDELRTALRPMLTPVYRVLDWLERRLS